MRTLSPLVGIAAFAGWIAAEIAAFNLVSSWTGGGVAFFLLVMKSVVGALIVQRIVRQKIFAILRRGMVVLEGADAARAWAKALGAFLLIAPGFVSGLAGLALFAPPVQRWIAERSAARSADPRDIELGAADWREMPEEPTRRIPAGKPPSEGR